jgi:hypothetical protein
VNRARSTRAAVLALALLVATPGIAAADPVLPDTKEIKQTTKKQDAGRHPVLGWKAVSGAARYLLVVQTPKGNPYWSWEGTENRVRLGGGPLDAPNNSPGATLTRKMVWFVVAFDEAGAIIASSAKRTIAP